MHSINKDITQKIDLTKIARNAIETELFGKAMLDTDKLKEEYSELLEEKATFVTLTIDGNLRGCIGSIIPHRILIDDLISNAKSAAFKDHRFLPLTKEEYKNISVEVSILTVPKKVNYKDKDELKRIIKPNIDGVIIKYKNHQATFLPQVWEQLPTFEIFFSHLAQKAGIFDDLFLLHPEVFLYQVQKIEEANL